MKPLDFKSWLQTEFNRRRQKNHRYSLRMFASLLEVPSGRLSEVLSGKRRLTEGFAKKAGLRLGLPPEQLNEFLRVIRESSNRRTPAGERAQVAEFQQLSVDSFRVIADWYHFAIINLMDTVDFQSDAKWIAQRLAISVPEAKAGLERLERLQLIESAGRGYLKKVGNLSTTQDLEFAALRNSHRQSLEQSIEALEEIPIDLRDITSISMAIDLKRIPEAKKLIQDFRRRLCSYLEDSSDRTEVYNLNVQLVPVTRLTSHRGN